MRDALLKQNRTIQFSLCVWGNARVEKWGNGTGHSWRMWADIRPQWSSLAPIINQASFLWNTTNFWGHNDWDMMEVGNGKLTIEENRSHFAMWCALKSPLIIGTPMDSIKQPIVDILSNKELIDFSQDPVYGASAMPYKWGYNKDGTYDKLHPAEYWTGTSRKGIHVFMLNTQDKTVKMSSLFSEIPALKGLAYTEYLAHDMWEGQDIGSSQGNITLDVKSHDTAAIRITTVDGSYSLRGTKWCTANELDRKAPKSRLGTALAASFAIYDIFTIFSLSIPGYPHRVYGQIRKVPRCLPQMRSNAGGNHRLIRTL